MGSFARIQHDTNEVGIQFLVTELDAAFTFLDVARETASPESRNRNQQHACDAYDTILRMQHKVVMEPEQQQGFQTRLANLKSLLEDLGCKPD